MSSTQSEVPTETPQATTPTPSTHIKNPKRVAAGKLVAERTCIAREQQKKALSEAAVTNNNAKQAPPPPDPALTKEGGEKNSSPLSSTQWLAVASIVFSLIGIYYKRKKLKVIAKDLFGKKTPEPAHFEIETQSKPAPTRLRTKMCER